MASNPQQIPLPDSNPISRPSSAASASNSPSTSPTNSRFSFPTRPASSLTSHQQHHYSPQKPRHTQPNPHPYAIKTTSTALLSRSSSTSSHSSVNSPSLNGIPGEGHGNVLYQERHRYVPPSPSTSDREGNGSPVKETRRHRYSRSLTDGPVPLPPPPGATTGEQQRTGHGHSRSQDLSTSATSPTSYFATGTTDRYSNTSPSPSFGRGHGKHQRESMEDFQFPQASSHNDIHDSETFNVNNGTHTSNINLITYTNSDPNPDPKTWTAQQLAAYLSLEDNSSGEDMESIVEYVMENSLSGRAFMRISEGDLDSLSENARQTLLAASRSLRQRSLRGRILGSVSTDGMPVTASAPVSRQNTGSSQADELLSGEDDFNPSFLATTTGSITIKRRNGVRPKKGMNIRPRDRAQSDASDSSVSSNTSEVSSKSKTGGGNGRVRGIVSSLEEKLSGSGLDEEGSASESGAEKARSSSPVKPSGGERKRALPQRGGVVDLFSSNGPSVPEKHGENSEELKDEEDKDTLIQGLAKKNANGREPRMLPFPPNVPPQSHGLHHMPTSSFPTSPSFSTQQQPLNPNFQQQQQQQQQQSHQYSYALQQHQHGHGHYLTPMHTGAGYSLPLSPNTTGTGSDYELGFRSSPGGMQVPPNQLRNTSPSDVATYVVRHGNSPSNSPALGGPAGNTNGSGNGQSRLLPYPPVVGHAVMHHPRPRKVGGGVVSGLGVGSESGIGGESGVEAGDEAGASNSANAEVEGETSTSQSGTDLWETALESPVGGSVSTGDVDTDATGTDDTKSTVLPPASSAESKKAEEEPSIEELLSRSHQNPSEFSTPPHKNISGVDAWEMELGDTVKRIGAGSSNRVSVRVKPRNIDSQRRKSSLGFGSTNGKAGGGSIMGLFEDAKGEEKDEERERKEKAQKEKEEDLQRRETDLTERENVVEQRERALGDAQAAVKRREESVDRKERDLEEIKNLLDAREKNVQEREYAVGEREHIVQTAEKNIQEKERHLDEKESTIQDKTRKVEEKERKSDEREKKVDRREGASSRWEEKLGEREELLEERENKINVKEQEVKEKEDNVKALQESVEEKEKEINAKEKEVDREKQEIEKLKANAVSSSTQTDAAKLADEGVQINPSSTDESTQAKPSSSDESVQASPDDINPSRPKPYLTTPWAIKRDFFIGRFVGAFTSLSSAAADGGGFGGGLGGLQRLKEGGGYLVLMSIGVCAFMLREVLGRGGARGGVNVWGGRR